MALRSQKKEQEGKKIEKTICRELQKLEMIKQRIKKQQNKKEEKEYQTLSCRKTKGHFQYLINQKYASKIKDLDKIKTLAREEYWKKLLPLMNKYESQLKAVQDTNKQLYTVYERMNMGKQVLFEPDIVPIYKKIQDFKDVTYEGLPFSENDKSEYYTHRGERVRSKSEKIIADELDRHEIPYHYEKPLLLRIDGQMKEFHPDFTVMNVTTGEVKYIEHLGMMDNPSYYNNVLTKLDVYERNGLLIGRDVILLHESSLRPLNTRIITDYVQEFLT